MKVSFFLFISDFMSIACTLASRPLNLLPRAIRRGRVRFLEAHVGHWIKPKDAGSSSRSKIMYSSSMLIAIDKSRETPPVGDGAANDQNWHAQVS